MDGRRLVRAGHAVGSAGPVLIVGRPARRGRVVLRYLWFFNREVLETEPGDIDVSSIDGRAGHGHHSQADGRGGACGRSRLRGGPARLESAVSPLPRGHRVLRDTAGRGQRDRVGAGGGHRPAGPQRPAQPGGLVVGRRRPGHRRQPDEERRRSTRPRARRRSDGAHPDGGGHGARAARLTSSDRLRRRRRPRRRDPRRRLRLAHPQHGNGLRQPDRRRDRGGRRPALAKVSRPPRTATPTCCGRAAAGAAATSGSRRPTRSGCTSSPTSRSWFASWTGHGELGDLLRTWQRDAPVADERLTSALEIGVDASSSPRCCTAVRGDELTEQLRSLLAIGEPEVTVTEDAWPTVYAEVDRAPADIPNWKFYSQFVTRPFPDEAIDLIVRFMANTPSPPSNFFCSSFGGAVRHAPPGGSAFPHRDALFYCEPGAAWNDPELNSKALGWAADFWRALRPYSDGAYVNVPNAAAADWERVLRRQPRATAAVKTLRPGERLQLRAERAGNSPRLAAVNRVCETTSGRPAGLDSSSLVCVVALASEVRGVGDAGRETAFFRARVSAPGAAPLVAWPSASNGRRRSDPGPSRRRDPPRGR